MKRKRTIIYFASFLFSIPIALTSYINSSFLESYVDKNHVGVVYIIASLITILGLLEMSKILTDFGNRKTTIIFCLLVSLSFFTLAFSKSIFLLIPAFILYFVSVNFVIASLDIFMEDFSKSSSIGTKRGFYLMIINLAWVVAQMISGSVINKNSFSGIYVLSALFMLLTSIIFIFLLRDFIDPEYKKISISKTFKSFVKNKHISKIYFINLILKFFFAWMVIYTPIYLRESIGFSWEKIGIIFTIMLIPFVIIDFVLGPISDRIGEKKMLLWGFFITFIFTLIIPFLTAPALLTWSIILFSTRVGAATIELMSESYFFKVVTEQNADEISFFRNTSPLSYLIAPLFAIPILILVPSFSYLFYVLCIILLVGFLIALRLRDIK